MPQHVAGRRSEAGGRLVVIQELIQYALRQIDVLPCQNGRLTRLVEIKFAAINGEAQRQRTVKHVRLAEAEQQHAGEAADVRLHLKGLTETEEIVGFVIQSDKRAFKPANATGQSDA